MRGVAVYSGERREALDGVLGSGSEPLELTPDRVTALRRHLSR